MVTADIVALHVGVGVEADARGTVVVSEATVGVGGVDLDSVAVKSNARETVVMGEATVVVSGAGVVVSGPAPCLSSGEESSSKDCLHW